MRAIAALGRFRAQAESAMRDTCRITKPGVVDDTHFNHETGQYDEPIGEVIYEGKCKIPTGASASFATANSGEQAFGVGEFPFELPFTDTSVNVSPGMTVEYLTAPDDPALEGRKFGIIAPLYQSQGTKLRFKIKTGVSGGGS